MPLQAIFGLSVLMGLVGWSWVALAYLWPALRRLPRGEALRPILLLHASRYLGMIFVVPSVVGPNLPPAFAVPAAYGDLIAALLALATLATLRSPIGVVFAWVFSVWGTGDLILAFVNGQLSGLSADQLGAAYFIPTFVVPLLLVTHALGFAILLRRNPGAA